MGLTEKLCCIEAPPGTGKTTVITAIVANWMKTFNNDMKILVCAPSNSATDLLVERLFSIVHI